MDPDVLSEIKAIETKGDFANPRYMELLMPNFIASIFVASLESWPDPINRAFAKLNSSIYVMMQGPSEFGIKGKLINWDIKSELPKIKVPTLVIGATHDTMDPEHMKWVSTQVKKDVIYIARMEVIYVWDDQEHYFPGLISFLKDVDNIKCKKVNFYKIIPKFNKAFDSKLYAIVSIPLILKAL
ncbi:MAG: hypothetical protein IPN97_08075 [Saprospiraceae bacterium]|nr:hypothetical protein [Saprospiraceae bacterium]